MIKAYHLVPGITNYSSIFHIQATGIFLTFHSSEKRALSLIKCSAERLQKFVILFLEYENPGMKVIFSFFISYYIVSLTPTEFPGIKTMQGIH